MLISTIIVWGFLVWMPRQSGEWTMVGQFDTYSECEQYRQTFFATYVNENVLIQMRPCGQIKVERKERT